jgi:hypothetical protein
MDNFLKKIWKAMNKRSLYILALQNNKIPDDIIALIDEYILKGLKKFQIKIRKYLYLKKNGYEPQYCSDCHKKCEPGEYLTETEACSDENGNCCHKYVCSSGLCRFYCPNKHINYIYQNNYYYNHIKCLKCKIEYLPQFTWFGLSPVEYDRRYN